MDLNSSIFVARGAGQWGPHWRGENKKRNRAKYRKAFRIAAVQHPSRARQRVNRPKVRSALCYAFVWVYGSMREPPAGRNRGLLGKNIFGTFLVVIEHPDSSLFGNFALC